MVGKLSNWITTGKSIDRIFPLAGAAAGYKYMESPRTRRLEQPKCYRYKTSMLERLMPLVALQTPMDALVIYDRLLDTTRHVESNIVDR
jgi:hypothetical protein